MNVLYCFKLSMIYIISYITEEYDSQNDDNYDINNWDSFLTK